MDDPFNLKRFLDAQEPVIATAMRELARGEKRSHWMWFVFPQIAGLGASPMAQRYAIASRDEAACYLAHPVLGPRLRECAEALLRVEGRTAASIFGEVDAMKLRSSMTLFAAVDNPDSVFARVLARYFDGPDPNTLARL
jgi:uncharacterized protein (DUF1810 family)